MINIFKSYIESETHSLFRQNKAKQNSNGFIRYTLYALSGMGNAELVDTSRYQITVSYINYTEIRPSYL